MNAITATDCDLRLARILALLLDDSPCIHLRYFREGDYYTLNAGPNDYLMYVGSHDDDFHFIPLSHNDADHSGFVSFSVPRFLRRD